MLLHSFQQVPWQQNDGEVNSPPLNACQAASAATIPDRFVDTAIKADRNKGVEAAAQGNSDEGENAASEGAEQGQGAASEGWLCVCVSVAAHQQEALSLQSFPHFTQFVCLYLLVLH